MMPPIRTRHLPGFVALLAAVASLTACDESGKAFQEIEFVESRGALEDAIKAYDTVREKYPGSEGAEKARAKIVELGVKLGKDFAAKDDAEKSEIYFDMAIQAANATEKTTVQKAKDEFLTTRRLEKLRATYKAVTNATEIELSNDGATLKLYYQREDQDTKAMLVEFNIFLFGKRDFGAITFGKYPDLKRIDGHIFKADPLEKKKIMRYSFGFDRAAAQAIPFAEMRNQWKEYLYMMDGSPPDREKAPPFKAKFEELCATHIKMEMAK